MKNYTSVFLLWVLVSLLTLPVYAQQDKPAWEPFLYSSGAMNKKESREITSLRNDFQQFMLTLSSSSLYDFNGLRSASNITVGSFEEESLQYLLEASHIIRMELVEKLPEAYLLAELKTYNSPGSASRQGMILGLRKDLDLYRTQMAKPANEILKLK